jgi:hypothetical protein
MLAQTVARVIGDVYASCALDDGSYACSGCASSSVSHWVEDVVRTWAGAWNQLLTCRNGCKFSVELVVNSVGHILVDATHDAYSSLCAACAPLPLAV